MIISESENLVLNCLFNEDSLLLNKNFEVPKEKHAIATYKVNLNFHRLITYLFNFCVMRCSSMSFTWHLDLFQDTLSVNAHSDFTWIWYVHRAKVGRSQDKFGIRIILTNRLDWYLETYFYFA